MKLNNRGFAFSSLIYILFLLFMVIIFSVLSLMGSRKRVLDKFKKDKYQDINESTCNNIYREGILNGADPVLTNNMIPISFDETNKRVVKANKCSNWYNYGKKRWANAVLVKKEKLANYQTSYAGTVIQDADVLAYLVWIPRYKYYIPKYNNNLIGIEFQSSSNKDNYCKISPEGNCANDANNMVTHPSFKFNEQELNGFWVAKFEPSFENNDRTKPLTILPNKSSYLSTDSTWNIQSMFKKTREMELYNNAYGFEQASNSTSVNSNGVINNDTKTIDPHLMKNTDWGAVTYLTLSKYGKGGEPDNNPYNNKTGGIDFYTNQSQSTTGNITGIYDMVGGSWEYVMGIHESKTEFILPYYDQYIHPLSIDIVLAGKLGDATHGELELPTIGGAISDIKTWIDKILNTTNFKGHNEQFVASWIPNTYYNPDVNFFNTDEIVSKALPYLTRGCNYADYSNSTLFCRYSRDGQGSQTMQTTSGSEVTVQFSFRPVITVVK